MGEDLENEYGTLLVQDNGNTIFYKNGFYTNNDPYGVAHPITSVNAPSVVSVVHNHPRQGSIYADINLEYRYPSVDDWAAADATVALGADPNVLTMTVIDPWGDARVFEYSDRNFYLNQGVSSRENGDSLPPKVPEDADLGECVKL
ncbi:hypothetical protein [Litorimonas haliclonae]|uniref:hypothetical protein n=1 Tax=Litorimonas haliclonae TaxID=2081977 RepID=UPI0039EF7EAA